METVLVTGGLGYIGSHICIELLENKYNLIIIDNLSNSSIEKLDIIKRYNKFNKEIYFYDNGIRNMIINPFYNPLSIVFH